MGVQDFVRGFHKPVSNFNLIGQKLKSGTTAPVRLRVLLNAAPEQKDGEF